MAIHRAGGTDKLQQMRGIAIHARHTRNYVRRLESERLEIFRYRNAPGAAPVTLVLARAPRETRSSLRDLTVRRTSRTCFTRRLASLRNDKS